MASEYSITLDFLNHTTEDNGSYTEDNGSYTESATDNPMVFSNGSSSGCGVSDGSNYSGEWCCSLYLFLVMGVLCGIVCILGIFGNALSLAVLVRLGRDSVTFLLLSVLAATDIVFLSGYLLFGSIPGIIYFFNHSHSTELYVIITHYGLFPLVAMAHSISVWITTLVTTYRYITASRLFHQSTVCSRASVYAQVAVIICFCVLFTIPRYWEREPRLVPNTTFIEFETTNVYYNNYYQIIYKNVLSSIFRRLIPLTLTTIMVWKRAQLLETWRQSRARTFNKPFLPEEQERLSKVLIVLAIVFVIAHIPITIYPVLRAISPPPVESCNNFFVYFSYFADFLVVANSAIPFYVFYPVSPRYRRITLEAIRRKKAHRRYVTSECSDISNLRIRMQWLRKLGFLINGISPVMNKYFVIWPY